MSQREHAKNPYSQLTDPFAAFTHTGRYADPLVPRKTSDLQFWPKDVTPEMEKKWLEIIEQHRA